MPSDPSQAPKAPVEALGALLEAVAPAYEAFRAGASAAADGVRSILLRRGSAAVATASLGVFGRSRIDADRFASLSTREDALDAASLDALRGAGAVLRRAAAAPAAEEVVVRVDPGGSMRDAVRLALTRLGRVFGAARVASLARSGRYRRDSHSRMLAGLDPSQWTPRERDVAPPLVVEVDGADLDAPALAAHLDGRARFALVVRGAVPPAPLARLLSPRTHVVQAADAAGLVAFARAAGPAVAALVPAGAACFEHDPSAPPPARLLVSRAALSAPRDAVGPWSPAQQADELALLLDARDRAAAAASSERTPAPGPASAPSSPVPASGMDPAARLTAWLLASVDEARLA